jgi:FxsC-like protein
LPSQYLKEGDLKIMSYLFFLSYAHDDNKPGSGSEDGLVKKFYDDLCDAVRAKTGLPENEIGFFDAEEIELGTKWSQELAEAIQTSSAFVSVFSPTYFRKPFCGQEWTVFNLRQQAYAETLAAGAEEPRLMIPVLWEKEIYVNRAMPAALKVYQYNHGGFGANYPVYGLRQILSDENLRKAYYVDFLDKFSDKLIEAADQHPAMPRLDGAGPLEEIEPVFPAVAPANAAAPQNGQPAASANPRYVKFVFVVGGQAELKAAQVRQRLEYYGESGAEWVPYLPDVKDEIDRLVKRIALDGDFSPEETISLNDDLLKRLEEAQDKNQIVVIVVDSWSLRIRNYHEWMRNFDEKSLLNCIVVIPWNNDDETTNNRPLLENVILATFQNRSLDKSPDFLSCVGSVDELKDWLGKTLRDTKEKIIRRATVLREISSGQLIVKPVISGTGKN